MTITVSLLFLLLIANGTPILTKIVLQDRFAHPLDGGRLFLDKRPFFGNTKTVRGIVSSLSVTALVAPLIGIPAISGAIFALCAMLGDLCSSFIKRRLGIASSKMTLGLDQIPESIFPLLAVKSHINLPWNDIFVIMAVFCIIELFSSPLLSRFSARKKSR
ncbi:MAG TPA: CDP-archaeol synthase [Gammaproteobacteria bacterium]